MANPKNITVPIARKNKLIKKTINNVNVIYRRNLIRNSMWFNYIKRRY